MLINYGEINIEMFDVYVNINYEINYLIFDMNR